MLLCLSIIRFLVMSCSSPQSSYAKMMSQSMAAGRGKNKSGRGNIKSSRGKNKFGYGRQSQVSGFHLRSSSSAVKHAESLLSDDDDNDDVISPQLRRRRLSSNNGGGKSSSSFDGNGDVGEGDFNVSECDDDDDCIKDADTNQSCSSSSSNDESSSASNDESSSASTDESSSASNDESSRSVPGTICANNSLPLHVSSSDSSLFIGPRRNPDRSARSKASSYEIGDDSSEVENQWTSSGESVSIAVSSDSEFAMPHLLKPSTRSSVDVSNVPCSQDPSMMGNVDFLHLASPERGKGSRRISTSQRIDTRSLSTAAKALRLLRLAKGENDGKEYCSGRVVKHKKAPQRRDAGTDSVAIPPEMTKCLSKSERRQIKSLLGNTKPALYYAWGEDYNENPKNAGKMKPPRMLDSERVKKCGLKMMYLVACNSDASLYSFTNSPERLHGGLWYFQLPQLYTLARSMDVLDRIVVVGGDECFQDDVAIVLNGREVMSLPSFHQIDFEGVRDRTDSVKADARRNNINVTYGYAKQGFESEMNEDGLHPPSMLNNTKNKPLIGKQYLALSKFIAEFDPEEEQFDRSTNLFHSRKKFAQLSLEATGHASPNGSVNIIENFSEIRNNLDLTRLEETKREPPCFPHFDDGNSAMDGFSSFFAVSKTEYDKKAGTVVRLTITGYNKSSVDNLMTQKVIADRVHILVGDVVPSTHVVGYVSGLLAEHSRRFELSSIPGSDLFVVDANPNISVFDSLSVYSLLSVLAKHGNAVPMVSELACALFLTNGNDKKYYAFKHLEELETLPKDNLTVYFANWCNAEFGNVFSKGKFQRFRPPTQKPYGLPVAISNNLVMRDVIMSANNDGQSFSNSMEVLKNNVHGVSTVQGPRVLRVLSNVGCIVPNDYAVQAELSSRLAKQVHPFVHRNQQWLSVTCVNPSFIVASLLRTG